MKGNLKRFSILCAVATAAAIILRFIQIEFITEPETGFFYKNYRGLGIGISFAIFAVVIILIAASAIYGKKPDVYAKPKKFFAAGNIIMAAAVVYEALFSSVGNIVPSWQILFQMILGLICAAIFLFNGLAAYRNTIIPPLWDTALVVFWLIRIMVVFSGYVSVSTIADNVFELTALCTMLVFFLNAAKMRNNVKSDKQYSAILPLAVLAFICCVTYSVPQIINTVLNGVSAHSGRATEITDLAMAIYISGFFHQYFMKNKRKKLAGQAIQMNMFENLKEKPQAAKK